LRLAEFSADVVPHASPIYTVKGAEQSENYEVELRESLFLQEEKHPIVKRFPGIARPPFE
jgi:hypothetical protein